MVTTVLGPIENHRDILNKFLPGPESLSAVPRRSFEVLEAIFEFPPIVCLSKVRCLVVRGARHFHDLSIADYATIRLAKPYELRSIVSVT